MPAKGIRTGAGDVILAGLSAAGDIAVSIVGVGVGVGVGLTGGMVID